jgi:DNA-binding transcriptional LysR family regulator
MRLEQLEYVAAVVEHGSLRKASEQLHVSQPALSEAVLKLERELGVTLLDRRRSGARISRQGRELLASMIEVLESAARLKTAAGDQQTTARTVRIGTVNAGTSALLVPAVREFQESRPATNVEVLDLQQSEIQQSLTEGSLDLGLVNTLAGDDIPSELMATVLVHGTPVVVLPPDHPLAAQPSISVDALRSHRFVAMRAGYLMHRFANRLFGSQPPTTTYSTDGAAMGMLMVAEGLGLTVLPDYSVVQDPLCRAGLITHRPITGDTTAVSLLLLQRHVAHAPQPVRDLRGAIVRNAVRYAEERARAQTSQDHGLDLLA